MKEIIEKFKTIEKELSEEKGEFNLFALFLREDSANKWDLLVSADWIIENKSETLKLITNKVQEHLEKKELVNLSRIVLIEENNPSLEAFHRAINVEHGSTEIRDRNFFGLQIKHAIIITSRKNKAEAS
jgi:hypothetical protein